MPEIRRLQTYTVRKGRSSLKEAAVTQQYEGRGLGLCNPFRTMGRGVHFCGEAKGWKARSHRETNGPQRGH